MIKRWLKEYIQVNKRDILIITTFILLGIIIGACVYIFSTETVRSLAISSVKEIFEISKGENYVKTNVILNGIKENILLICILSFLSITLFGKWMIYAVMILKGVSISLYTILLFNLFGPWWGIVVTLLLVILVNIIYIPALIYVGICFLDINFNIFKVKINNMDLALFYKAIFSIIFSLCLMFSSVIVEQIASSVVLNIYQKL